jgi:hypothetical protein
MNGTEYSNRLRSILALNRNRSIKRLVSEIPIQALIDEDFCIQVSAAMNSISQKWQKLRAHPDVGTMLPDRHGIYMFCWEPPLVFQTDSGPNRFDWCLYVGKASETTIRTRFEGEYKKYIMGDPRLLYETTENMSRERRLAKYLCLQPLSIWFLVVDDKPSIPDLEDKLIDLLNPPLNKQKSIRGRYLEAETAF